MKLWGVVRTNNQIQRQATIDYESITRQDAVDWNELVGPLCLELDLSRPVILSKHLREINEFSRVVFRPDDFIESVDFDKFEIEIYYKKKK